MHGVVLSVCGSGAANMEVAMRNLVREQLADGLAVLQAVAADTSLHATLAKAAEATAAAMKAGGKLMVAGNGGIAADAQHLVAEFVCRLCEDHRLLDYDGDR